MANDDLAAPRTEAIRYKFDASAGAQQLFTQSDIGVFGARVLGAGENTPLVTRAEVDVFCMVKKGRIRITGASGEMICELGEMDGAVLPAGAPYAIEAIQEPPATAEFIEFHASQVPLSTAYQPFSE